MSEFTGDKDKGRVGESSWDAYYQRLEESRVAHKEFIPVTDSDMFWDEMNPQRRGLGRVNPDVSNVAKVKPVKAPKPQGSGL